jgi:adenosylmethionine-8-amino-7-oxononanoate aminotransferase
VPIADEIITGFGGVDRWLGLEHWNLQADIECFAKGVTSGYLTVGGMMLNIPIKEAMDAFALVDGWGTRIHIRPIRRVALLH